MNKYAAAVLALLVVLTACSRNVVSPGNDIRGDFPDKTHTLSQLWDDAEGQLFAIGKLVDLNTYTEEYAFSGDGIMVIDVQSSDFDPMAAVVDREGRLVAFNDDWKGSVNSRIVLEEAPSGGKLLVFSPDDSRGLYDVVVREGDDDDLQAFAEATDLSSGTVSGTVSETGRNPAMAEILKETLQNDVYVHNFSSAELFHFSFQGEELVSLSVESADFDTYLVLMRVEDDSYSYIADNDDFDGTNSRIVQELEAGDYIALVMPYSEGGHGDFHLSLEPVSPHAMEKVEVQAPLQNTDYSGLIVPERNYALAWWPGMMSSWDVPGFLSPFTPVAVFTFDVDQPAIYQLDAFSDMDVCLTLIRTDTDSVQVTGYNDDYENLGTDSRIVAPLLPGSYAALVSAYSSSMEGEVGFSWETDDEEVGSLRRGAVEEVFTPVETESLIYSFNVSQGAEYTVSVTSQEMDPVISLYLSDGSVLVNDDGGEGTNSLLAFIPETDQGGMCYLVVEKYSPAEGTFRIELD
ncbi:MAG: hypothetical protein GF388_02725 [Candidatus Aegiribacteria sp.]|nr:hypothetical protein [Candidatus Aegiribacteria sp.]MBD3294210.1 hypothetical protein [Candidatus Fermentibacteria bacterium]